jgi:hypothetical protein
MIKPRSVPVRSDTDVDISADADSDSVSVTDSLELACVAELEGERVSISIMVDAVIDAALEVLGVREESVVEGVAWREDVVDVPVVVVAIVVVPVVRGGGGGGGDGVLFGASNSSGNVSWSPNLVVGVLPTITFWVKPSTPPGRWPSAPTIARENKKNIFLFGDLRQ